MHKSRISLIRKIMKMYINMTIDMIHILSNVVKISSNIQKTAIFSQFLKFFKNTFAYNFKTHPHRHTHTHTHTHTHLFSFIYIDKGTMMYLKY